MRPLSLIVPAAAIAAALSTPTAASEQGEADVQFQLQGRTRAAYTAFGPRPLDTILSFLRQESLESPVPGIQDRLRDLLDRVDTERVVARMVEQESVDPRHPFARVVEGADGRPVLEFALPTWNARARTYQGAEATVRLKDLTVAATLHAWEHSVLHHRLDPTAGEQAIERQEAEVWQEMVVNVLVPGRKAQRFAFSEREDLETYYGLLCFAAADSRLDHPAWKAFLDWIAAPEHAAGVPVCREVERDRSARL